MNIDYVLMDEVFFKFRVKKVVDGATQMGLRGSACCCYQDSGRKAEILFVLPSGGATKILPTHGVGYSET